MKTGKVFLRLFRAPQNYGVINLYTLTSHLVVWVVETHPPLDRPQLGKMNEVRWCPNGGGCEQTHLKMPKKNSWPQANSPK